MPADKGIGGIIAASALLARHRAFQHSPHRNGAVMKTTVKSIAIIRPFQLPGMAQPHPPGVFELQIDEEPIDVTWEAYHTTMTLLLSSNGRTEAWPVSREEFEKTLAPSIAP